MNGKANQEKLLNLPFPPILPENLHIHDLSVRDVPEKRKTLRYFIEMNNKIFRVKEFFMDWFYTGFPKSIMSSLMDLYGPVEVYEENDLIWYYCRNYKGNDSVSLYFNGTTVEIECYETASPREFRYIINDFDLGKYLKERFQKMGFAERAFLSDYQDSSWWENERIGRITWKDIEMERGFNLGEIALKPATVGCRKGSDGSRLTILILAEPYFRRVVWVEAIEEWSNIPHGIYRFRKEVGLFDTISGDEIILFHRSPVGPSAIRSKYRDMVVTITFSPGFSLDEVEWIGNNIDKVLDEKWRILTEALKQCPSPSSEPQ